MTTPEIPDPSILTPQHHSHLKHRNAAVVQYSTDHSCCANELVCVGEGDVASHRGRDSQRSGNANVEWVMLQSLGASSCEADYC